ncbi:phage holin family protein [Cyclobacterium plantarum]|uniref:Holin n=1 Tax=Cyclobacterium plantarum TaxID=2716263 RepID=A0ABX0HC87_9BACT|nr:phage holin family protein [Cyclobacterium plantarum]NHE57964.1 hypothetical protein [Cyclobacterium plantarum]
MWGFSSFSELITATFKNIGSEFVIKYIVPIILAIDLLFKFLFISEIGVYFLMALYGIDFLTGIIKAIITKNLVSKRFPRFLFTMLSALLILSILKYAGMFVVVFYPLYSIFYGVFVGQQIISIVENLTALKLLPLEVLNKIKSKISEYGSNKQ